MLNGGRSEHRVYALMTRLMFTSYLRVRLVVVGVQDKEMEVAVIWDIVMTGATIPAKT